MAGLKPLTIQCGVKRITVIALEKVEVEYIKREWLKVDTSIKGNKMKFCSEMQHKFNLKSRNTIFWIITGGTNKFISVNQDIVQTTNRDGSENCSSNENTQAQGTSTYIPLL